MKKLILFTVVLFISCKEQNAFTKKYIVSKSDDNNWTTSATIECDSVTMINRNKAKLWVDGRELNLEGQIIKIFSNINY